MKEKEMLDALFYNGGMILGRPNSKFINIVRAHDTINVNKRQFNVGKRVTLTKNPYDRGGTVIHLDDNEAQDLLNWLKERYE